jgi:hypothetical protein
VDLYDHYASYEAAHSEPAPAAVGSKVWKNRTTSTSVSGLARNNQLPNRRQRGTPRK